MSDISDDDKKLFRQAIQGVTPLKNAKKESLLSNPNLNRDRPNKKAILATNASEPNENTTNVEISYTHLADHEPQPQFSRGGIQHKQLKKLKQAKLPIEDEIDLHHMTLKEAETAVRSFLQNGQKFGMRCVKIIHGRGHHSKPNSITLLHMVRYLLTQLPCIIAYTAAPSQHGGNGATLVLIRRGNL